MAEWIVEGGPTMDLISADLRRFSPLAGNTDWLRARVGEVLGLHYALPWPNRELETGRPLRRSPVHELLVAQGACLGSRNNWERANVFAPKGVPTVIEYSWDRPSWVDWSVAEQRATREAVAVFDQTSFSKYLVVGKDAEQALQWLCTADVAVPVGRAVYTGMLNARGTYESDVTVTRTGRHEYLVVSSAATTDRDVDWMRRHLPEGCHASVVDVTSAYAVFGVMGPRSAQLLSALSHDCFDDEAFPFGTSREVRIGSATVRATRITYVGELGWELYVPCDLAVGVYEDLFAAGKDLGVVPAGYYAIEAMRLEKGYRAFGRELTTELGPVEAGLLFACKLGTDIDFLGRAAVEQVRSAPPARRIVSFVLDDPSAYPWGGELVLRDGAPVGQVTSAAWGATLGSAVGLALVGDRASGTTTPQWVREGAYEIDLAGQRFPATVTMGAPFDAEGRKLGRRARTE
jgi:4-methylaminobutanoate oxidase (formaldehyde-forming)